MHLNPLSSGDPEIDTPYIPRSILVTGGAGFIGSNFVRGVLAMPDAPAVVVLDALTYAGNLENLADLEGRFTFVHADICDSAAVARAFADHAPDAVVHFAAESHVDRSILGPLDFTRTNVLGTHVLMEAARAHRVQRFVHVSTDEVYGSLGPDGRFTEESPLDPTSPYAASKAASDLVVLAGVKTYGFPAMVTRCSNNYGPYQFPEKLIPLMILNALEDQPLPVYGDGRNVRDWIHTADHCAALWAVLTRGRIGDVYNIGAGNEQENITIVRQILRTLGKPESLIRFVDDRPAHDRRYAIDPTKTARDLGWTPAQDFAAGLDATIAWYVEHRTWCARVRSGVYREYYTTQYGARLS